MAGKSQVSPARSTSVSPMQQVNALDREPTPSNQAVQQSLPAKSGPVSEPSIQGRMNTRQLSADLGTAESWNDVAGALGGFVDGLVPVPGSTAEGKATVTVKTPYCDIAVTLKCGCENDGNNIKLNGGVELMIAKVFDLAFVEAKVGAKIGGGVSAAGDSGKECFDLFGLGVLNSCEAVFGSRVSGFLFGDTNQFKTNIIRQMDDESKGDEKDYISGSFSAAAFAELNAEADQHGPSMKMGAEAGYRRETEITRGRGLSLKTESSNIGFFKYELGVGPVTGSCEIEHNATKNETKLTVGGELEVDPRVSPALSQAAAQLSPLIALGASKGRSLGVPMTAAHAGQAAFDNALRTKLPTQAKSKMTLSLQVEMNSNGTGSISLSVAKVSSFETPDAPVKLELEFTMGQKIFDVPFSFTPAQRTS